MLFCDHAVSLEFFKILASSNSEFYFKNKESLLVSLDKPELNRNGKSSPLYLFYYHKYPDLVRTQVEIISDPNYLVRILFER